MLRRYDMFIEFYIYPENRSDGPHQRNHWIKTGENPTCFRRNRITERPHDASCLANCHATVQKLLIRQVQNKSDAQPTASKHWRQSDYTGVLFSAVLPADMTAWAPVAVKQRAMSEKYWMLPFAKTGIWTLSLSTVNVTAQLLNIQHQTISWYSEYACVDLSSTRIDWLSCGFTSHSTQNRPSFQRRFPKPVSWSGMEKKLNLTQQKHAFTNQRNVLQHKINTKN